MIGSPLGGGAPGGFGSAGPGAMGAGPMSARPPAGDQAACADEFQRLGGELGKRKQATDATFKRNAPPPDRCKAITEFAAAMGKMLKFVKDKRAACGIPQNLEDTLVKNNAALQTAKTKICAAGPMQGAPAAPSLSDALGTTRLPTPEATKPNLATGTLNTLTGTALGGR